jgi:hypothetical protein
VVHFQLTLLEELDCLVLALHSTAQELLAVVEVMQGRSMAVFDVLAVNLEWQFFHRTQ